MPDVERVGDTKYDDDENHTLTYGHPAGMAEAKDIATFIARYYNAARNGDGARACSMIYGPLARSIPEDYGGSTPVRAQKSCAAIVARLFKRFRAALLMPVRISNVRVGGDQAYAFFRSSDGLLSYITLQREHGTWKIDGLRGGPVR